MRHISGGPPPFDQVVREHGPTVLRVCRAVLGSDADDAWSETFLAALRAWPGSAEGPIDNVEAWLVRIAQRKCVDVLRARQRRAVPTDPVDASPAGSVRPPADASGVWDEVARLPERQRLAVAYHWFGGLPHTETARLIGGTPEAVRRSAADGLATLRRRLTAEGPDGPATPRPDPSRPSSRGVPA